MNPDTYLLGRILEELEKLNAGIAQMAERLICNQGVVCSNHTLGSTCTIPPEGWRCSRNVGHEGPCAARPEAYYFYPANRVPCPNCLSYWDDQPHECNEPL
jgi:hypothetical protein